MDLHLKAGVVFWGLVMCVGGNANAQFDWGGNCDSGDGSFSQAIPYQGSGVTVGEIPTGKANVRISLAATNDVDIQLITEGGHEIIAWPNGDLNDAGQGCIDYNDVEYCYSGYDGVGGNPGHEFIQINGITNVALNMKAWGYESGDAIVDYSWEAVDTCNEKGQGRFSRYIPQRNTVVIGDIPANKINVKVELTAAGGKDVDVQLYDGATAIVNWQGGLLSGATSGDVEYRGMTIKYSGYNGIGGNWGHETIEVVGRVTRTLTMKAYGYQAGTANVEYEWGIGAGERCGGRANPPLPSCSEGFVCKGPGLMLDAPGGCHTEFWCDSNYDYSGTSGGIALMNQCGTLMHPAVPGNWGCEEFRCKWIPHIFENECVAAGYECVPHIKPWHVVKDEFTCGGLKASCVENSFAEEGEACGGLTSPPNPPCADGLECVGEGLPLDIPGTCQPIANDCTEETVATDCAHLPNLAPPAYKACVNHQCVTKIHKNSMNEDCSGGIKGVFCEWGLTCNDQTQTCLPDSGYSWVGGDCNGGFASKLCVEGLECYKPAGTYPNVPGVCQCPTTVDCEPPFADDAACAHQTEFSEICPDVVYAL